MQECIIKNGEFDNNHNNDFMILRVYAFYKEKGRFVVKLILVISARSLQRKCNIDTFLTFAWPV